MKAIDTESPREIDIEKIASSKEETCALQLHLAEIIEGRVFKGSHRSCQFLKYIVDQAIAGHFDSLKERVIGVELFDRSATYNTSDDAIVRVTASDVRKRLLQHYGKYGSTSEFRINLQSGSYIPKITRVPRIERRSVDRSVTSLDLPTAFVPPEKQKEKLEAGPSVACASRISGVNETVAARLEIRQWLSLVLLIGLLNAFLWAITDLHRTRRVSAQSSDALWSTLFNPTHPTHLITSDPNIVVVQEITGKEITVSDYANHKYIPIPNQLTPEQIRISQKLLWGDNSAAGVDPPIAARIAALDRHNSGRIDVRAARSIRLTDLKNDDSFVLLGSPRSNPWSALFDSQLDFTFAFDNSTHQEFVRNIHPRLHEAAVYTPTAQGWATGQSFAIVAFVQNLDQHGQVLLLAGASGEGTEAAGELATDIPRLSAVLQKCGIDPAGPIPHFELLLSVNTMAGAPNSADIVACHTLQGAPAQKP